jgi:hypothetical protein
LAFLPQKMKQEVTICEPGSGSHQALNLPVPWLTDIQSPELWKGISVVYKLVHELGTSDSDL